MHCSEKKIECFFVQSFWPLAGSVFRPETWYSHAPTYPLINSECIVSEETGSLFYCVAKVMYAILIIVI